MQQFGLAIQTVCSGPVDTNGYIIVDEATSKAVIVDAPMDSADWYVQRIRKAGWQVTDLWLTHSHWDHTADCAKLKRELGLKIFLHQADEYRLYNPNAHTVFALPFELEGSTVDAYFHHGDILHLGSQCWELRHTPGHTEGGVCFVNHDDGVVIAGDTLFHGSIGRTDLPGGNMEQLISSIHRELLTLEDHYRVLCGHMDPTTIGEERDNNPFLQDQFA